MPIHARKTVNHGFDGVGFFGMVYGGYMSTWPSFVQGDQVKIGEWKAFGGINKRLLNTRGFVEY